MKIRPEGDELLRADGRTDMTKLIVPFAVLLKPKNSPMFISRLHYLSNCEAIAAPSLSQREAAY